MHDDMIDFPCSADWIDYYHERGLTPRSSGRPNQHIEMLVDEIKRLREENREILEALRILIEERSRRKERPRREEAPKRRIERLRREDV